MGRRVRYCQRCDQPQHLDELDAAKPCFRCGSTNFDRQPRLHSESKFYQLTKWFARRWRGCDNDADFLRSQGIDPQDGW
jgi:hypothetical protein